MGAPRPLIERFMEKFIVDRVTGCWVWTAARKGNGYGQIGGPHRKVLYAHRVAYEHFVGPIADGFQLDHLCRNRACVNPEHLEAVTPRVNVIRGESPFARRAAQTHCIQGHEFTPENTYIRPDNGTRRCHVCRNRLRQESRERLSA